MSQALTSNPHTRTGRLGITVCALLLGSLLLGGCASSDEEMDGVSNAEKAYEDAQEAMNSMNYRRAIQLFQAIQSYYPFSDTSKQIQLDLMYAFYKSNKREEAIDAADQFLRENPTHPRVDYAIYIKALANFDQDPGALEKLFNKGIESRPPIRAKESFSLFKRLVEQYPASEYAEDSRQRMVFLKNRLAGYENLVARFYLDNGAYVAAANRARNALEEYNGADNLQESLEILVAAYEKLGMAELATDARRVLAENFPDSDS
jgi:outer membrane protein assembly factor BamD